MLKKSENKEDSIDKPAKKNKGMWASIVSGIFWPTLFFVLTLDVIQSPELIIISFVLNFIAGFCCIIGGFYIFIIPINVSDNVLAGCVKKHLPLKIRIPLAILMCVLPVLSIILCFV